MADFEDVDAADAPEVLGKLTSIKVAWDPKDLKWWFTELEMQMTLINIQSQWIKRVILSNNLPDSVKSQVKDILKKTKSQAPAKVYKTLKTKVLELFGPREGDRFEEAASLVLTTTPSALAKRITELLCECDGDTPLTGCCQAETVSALWRRQLPQSVRSRIAGLSLKTSYDTTLKLADDVFAALGAPGVSAVGASVAADEDPEVAAVGRGGARGGPRGRSRGRARGQGGASRGRGESAQAQGGQGQRQRKRHPEAIDGCCKQHFRYGPNAYSCTDPDNCTMVNQISTPRY